MTDVFLRALVLLVKIRVATFFSDVNEQNLAILLASWCENCSCHGWTGENEVPCSHGCFSQWPSGKVIRELSERGDGPASVARTSVGFRGSGVHDASDPSPTRPLQFLAPVRTPLLRTLLRQFVPSRSPVLRVPKFTLIATATEIPHATLSCIAGSQARAGENTCSVAPT